MPNFFGFKANINRDEMNGVSLQLYRFAKLLTDRWMKDAA
jgi:hypothetical protein